MSTSILNGHTVWDGGRDNEGHREYHITFLVLATSALDGPANVLQTPGLPVIGSLWAFDNDIDVWAWCQPDMKVKPKVTGEPNYLWTVDCTFSTKPVSRNSQRCSDQTITNPLLEPQKISGSYSKYQREAAYDRFGKPIINSAWELIKGSTVEFDANRPQVNIEQNVSILNLALVTSMLDTLNTSSLWGCDPRQIKLTDFQWERKIQGYCGYYFTRKFTFDINPESFDRLVLDEGNKCLNGKNVGGSWQLLPVDGVGTMPNRFNPLHFIRYKDANGENARCILDGAGKPIFTTTVSTLGIYNISITNLPFGDQIVDVETYLTHGMKVGQKFTISGVLAPADAYNVGGQVTTANTPVRFSFRLPRDIVPGAYAIAASGGTLTFQLSNEALPGKILVQKYNESNFLLLGIPTIFG